MVDKWPRVEYNTAYTIAEVAEVKSILQVAAIAGRGKGLSPKGVPLAGAVHSGVVQKMCGTVIARWSAAGKSRILTPCVAPTQGIYSIGHLPLFCVLGEAFARNGKNESLEVACNWKLMIDERGSAYEEDIFSDIGEGEGDPQ